MLGDGLARAQQQPVAPAGASAAHASQAEAAGKAASTKGLAFAHVQEGASSRPTEAPATGMSKNQMKKLAKQQRSVHSRLKPECPPFPHPALLPHAMPETEHLRFFGTLLPVPMRLLHQRQAMCGFSGCSCSQSAFVLT